MKPDQQTIGIVERLCRALEAENVIYCHWKSNDVLGRSATGENDLDLLVRRADVEAFRGVLARLSFKRADAPPGRRMPGVQDYYGYDSEVDRIVHVHAHYQLIAGHDMTKNYLLPIERPYLDSAIREGVFRIPVSDFEYVTFILRMVLKHSTWDAMVIGHGQLTAGDRRELAFLQARINHDRVAEIVEEYLPFIGAELFDKCVQAIQPSSSVRRRLRTGHQLQAAMKALSRRGRSHDSFLKVTRRVKRGVLNRLFGYRPKKTLSAGGAIVAIVGGDGAGKSTAVDELSRWLSRDFDTVQVHMGRPPRSATTVIVRGVLALGRVLRFYPHVGTSVLHSSTPAPATFRGKYPWMVRQACKARDRYRAFRKAKRHSIRGGIVVTDRYPVPEITLMDGPVIRQIVNGEAGTRLGRFLMALEDSFYMRITPPDALAVLKVDPDVAVDRKTDEDPAQVRIRSTEVWRTDWQRSSAIVIDGHQPPEGVLAELKSLIWSRI